VSPPNAVPRIVGVLTVANETVWFAYDNFTELFTPLFSNRQTLSYDSSYDV